MAARITAAATPITFIDKDGNETEEFWFSPLTDREFDEIDEWLQARMITIARRSFEPDTTQHERDETLQAATREATAVQWFTQQGRKMLATTPGMTHITWVSLRRRHPNIKKSFVRELVSNKENNDRVNAALVRVNSNEVDELEAADPESKKETGK